MSNVFYHGKREPDYCFAWKYRAGVSYPLNPRNDLWNHSPDGFNWGYGGSGPAQLALAILVDALGDELRAVEMHQQFKWDHVARWHGETWRIGLDEVLTWAYKHDQDKADEEHQETAEDDALDLAAPDREEKPTLG